jgi:hypothetical protein
LILKNLDNGLLFNIIESKDKVNNNKEVNKKEVNYNINGKNILDYKKMAKYFTSFTSFVRFCSFAVFYFFCKLF